MAVAKDKKEALLSLLKERGVEPATAIGEITAKSEGNIILRNNVENRKT